MALTAVERRRADLESLFARWFGGPVKLTVAPGAAAAADPGAAPATSLAAVEQAEREARTASVRAKAKAHPNIQEAARILDGEVTKIDEL
jgi:DNA polymerase-3 subunit gamma/tau